MVLQANSLPLEIVKTTEARTMLVASRPITFEEFLDLCGEDDATELIDGALVEQMAAQLDHERMFAWLFRLTGDYVESRQLGMILGSRTAVQINLFRGRLPDILFVRRDRLSIVQERALYGPPDLVVEIVSPGDNPSDLVALETDYRSIGVAEIWFIDRHRGQVLVVRKQEDNYDRETLTEGELRSEAIEGLHLPVEWLLEETRPTVAEALHRVMSAS